MQPSKTKTPKMRTSLYFQDIKDEEKAFYQRVFFIFD